ncbi:MAG: homoserine dehydrogenase [Peptococcaceae bacterium]|nr:homoserine dehydrogenase [Peptococcaceae bacterium]
MSGKPIYIGLLGLGTVGRGVFRLLQANKSLIERKVGGPVDIKKILVRDLAKNRGLQVEPGLLTNDPEAVLNDPEIDIIVELIGGTGLAADYVLKALSRGKSVVTANKDMMAEYGKKLFAEAEAHNCGLFFEASVAGGIPIIKVLKQSLAGNRILQIMGIVNGTTNYMLTRMSKEGIDFATALRAAQEQGYAEADPTNDIEGYDAARKIAILASIAFNTRVSFQDVYVEGISNIAAEDITYARELGYTIKLLGIAKDTSQGIEVRVHPALLPVTHPLAAVNDAFNAVFVQGDAVGETMFYGRGAGEMPTASAVMADIMDAARNFRHHVPGMIGCTCYETRSIKSMAQVVNKNYLRLKVVDKPGVLAQIAQVFGDNNVSLATVIQKETVNKKAELVLVTHDVVEQSLRSALASLELLPVVEKICNVIRVEGEGNS